MAVITHTKFHFNRFLVSLIFGIRASEPWTRRTTEKAWPDVLKPLPTFYLTSSWILKHQIITRWTEENFNLNFVIPFAKLKIRGMMKSTLQNVQKEET